MARRKPPAKPRTRSSSSTKGRPSLCTPQAIEAIVAHLETGGGLRSAHTAAGVSNCAVFEWMARGRAGDEPYAELVRRVEGTRAAVKERLRARLLELAESDDEHVAGTNIRWILERNYPDEYGRRQELTGPKGGPVQVEASARIAAFTDEQIAAMTPEERQAALVAFLKARKC